MKIFDHENLELYGIYSTCVYTDMCAIQHVHKQLHMFTATTLTVHT